MIRPSRIDAIIAALRPGQSARITATRAGFVSVERSGDGQVLRYVRHIAEQSVVFHRCAF